MSDAASLRPTALKRDGADRLVIDWNDGVRSTYTWKQLRASCPCATCREERDKPPDPFRILKPTELAPLAPMRVEPVGRYAYKITWSDGHDSGIYSLDYLRSIAESNLPIG